MLSLSEALRTPSNLLGPPSLAVLSHPLPTQAALAPSLAPRVGPPTPPDGLGPHQPEEEQGAVVPGEECHVHSEKQRRFHLMTFF